MSGIPLPPEVLARLAKSRNLRAVAQDAGVSLRAQSTKPASAPASSIASALVSLATPTTDCSEAQSQLLYIHCLAHYVRYIMCYDLSDGGIWSEGIMWALRDYYDGKRINYALRSAPIQQDLSNALYKMQGQSSHRGYDDRVHAAVQMSLIYMRNLQPLDQLFMARIVERTTAAYDWCIAGLLLAPHQVKHHGKFSPTLKEAIMKEFNAGTTDRIPQVQYEKLMQSMQALQAALLEKDPLMPQHLKASHEVLVGYPETVHLLDDAEVAALLQAAQQHKNISIIKAPAKPATSRKVAKLSADDL